MNSLKLFRILKTLQHQKDKFAIWLAYKIVMRTDAAKAWVADPVGIYLLFHTLMHYELNKQAALFRWHFFDAGIDLVNAGVPYPYADYEDEMFL